ncbi:MAG: CPBP family glutamic-type intramembrane protease [Myxococcota bacterium]
MPRPLSWLARYHRSTRRPAGAALVALPLALLYGLGLPAASPGARSGVDVVSGWLLGTLGLDGYLLVQAGVAVVVAAVVAWHLRGAFWRHAALTGPAVGEAAAYGIVMSALILHVMERQHLLGPILVDGDLFEHAVIAAGAGLHEEIVFRLLLLPLVALVGERLLAMPRPIAWTVAVVASSLAFAGAHHLTGEPWDEFAFTYRTLAGVFFSGVFLLRGFAVAAWAHAAYDLHVLTG